MESNYCIFILIQKRETKQRPPTARRPPSLAGQLRRNAIGGHVPYSNNDVWFPKISLPRARHRPDVASPLAMRDRLSQGG